MPTTTIPATDANHPDSLLGALCGGATVVTVNSRLARTLTGAYASLMRDGGTHAWPTPDVLTLDRWLRRCWDQHLDALPASLADVPPLPLDDTQEAAVWEQVLAESPSGRDLVLLSAAADTARRAYGLLRRHRVPLRELAREKGETVHFRDWASSFEKLCAAGGWTSGADLAGMVADVFARGSVSPPARIIFAGFDTVTPVLVNLADVLRKAGSEVEMVDGTPSAGPAAAVRVGLPDAAAEYRAAAAWARRIVEKDRNARVGVVVPTLQDDRAAVVRVFMEAFHPSSVAAGMPPRRRAFNVTYGTPLASEPVVRAALLLLESVADDTLPLHTATRLLLNPFLPGGVTHAGGHGAADARLRKDNNDEVGWKAIANKLPDDSPLRKVAEKLGRERAGVREPMTPGARVKQFIRILTAAGWPGGVKLDSREAQAVKAWRDVLAKVESLDCVVGPEGYGETLSRLRASAEARLFQPEGSDAPVQVMGVFEAKSLTFTHLWITGMHDGAWPVPPSPNPLLPVALQARHSMGNANVALANAFSEQVTGRLLGCAPVVVVSWPLRNEIAELRPSPLITHLREEDPAEMSGTDDTAPDAVDRLLFGDAPDEMDELDDGTGPRVELPPDGSIRGGTSLIQAQAQCPFRAFAQYRLEARKFETPSAGVDPTMRGRIVHDALRRVWGELLGSATLHGCGDEALEELCAEAAEAAVEAECGRSSFRYGPKLKALEARRTTVLLLEWFALERARTDPFEVVLMEELAPGAEPTGGENAGDAARVVEIGPVHVQVRRDRVDKVHGEGTLLIDYKTGEISTWERMWDAQRPCEPQLLVYLLASPEPDVCGIAIGRVQRGKCGVVGLGSAPLAFGGRRKLHVADDWDAARTQWKETLEALVGKFRGGDARVDPVDGKACQYCPYDALCRIHGSEESLGDGTDEGAESGGVEE